MNNSKLNTIEPLYCPSKKAMGMLSDTHHIEYEILEPLFLGQLGRNVVVNIPLIPATASLD